MIGVACRFLSNFSFNVLLFCFFFICRLRVVDAEHIALARPVELQASLRIAGGEAVPRNQAFEKIADLFYGPRKNCV
uniref:Secreted protein n=1 Tax=Aegilops tauschii subsp. strangulata TaxID=200361 RepID=A0A452XBS4_AEGTS